jgi:hypothetical protein
MKVIKRQSAIIWIFFIFIGIYSIYRGVFMNMGEARFVELFAAQVLKNPSLFINDLYGLTYAQSANWITPWIVSNLSPGKTIFLFYLILIISVFLIFKIGSTLTKDKTIIGLFIGIAFFGSYNGLGRITTGILGTEFTGSFLATPFLLLSLLTLFERKMFFGGILTGIAFYAHPGLTVWYCISITTPMAVFIIRSIRKSTDAKNIITVSQAFKFVFPLIILILPRLYETLIIAGKPLIPDSVLNDIAKYAWPSSLVHFRLVFEPDKYIFNLCTIISLFSSFLIIVHWWKFNPTRHNQNFLMLGILGSGVFLFINDLVVYFFEPRFVMAYTFNRVESFMAFFMHFFLAAVITSAFRNKKIIESSLWLVFLMNYMILFNPIIHAFVFLFILILKIFQIDMRLNQKFQRLSMPKISYELIVSLFFLAFIFAWGGRVVKNVKNPQIHVVEKNYFKEAVLFLNNFDTGQQTIAYSFDKVIEFSTLSKKPGFFNTEYIVLFNILYRPKPHYQKSAYKKYREIERDLGIDSFEALRTSHLHFQPLWAKAWREKVTDEILQKWYSNYQLGFVIREKPYVFNKQDTIYENKKYIVYKVNENI